ncbi:hypothetical protein QU617_09695 [Pseudomonas guariconensis]|uniref:hypothetical protein n=1 Tax=Pseudomonas guariconensis TaxID=1288410 RepID=UPI0025AA0C82|nr:hypothetical protein [Pseudomonas guariconensis]MDM9593583.1 hypothetical protein [Pseudomonas guariconensis]MDM9606410.1 hypothetical protein [Pseudomonas guariconensis]MDM9611366.1 hypothetical protein [Pseudomonas guariconensis]
MNLIDCYVTKILGEPYRKFGAWWVDVEYRSSGRTNKIQLMFRTQEGAKAARVGQSFVA